VKTSLTRHSGIFIKKSNIHGWGVFTNSKILENEIVEECIIPDEKIPLNSDILKRYYFIWPKTPNYNSYCLPLGFACTYNHSTKPNVKWLINEKEKLMIFIAIKDINKNEELVHNYTLPYINSSKEILNNN